MANMITTPQSRPPAKPRTERKASAVIAQYIHELSAAGARASSVAPRPTELGHCWGCA